MYSLEKLKELAVNQMRAATNLYEMCKRVEGELTDNETYNKLYVHAQCKHRFDLLTAEYGMKPTEEEKDLWDEIMEELD